MAQIFRLKNWTHYEQKPVKRNAPGLRSVGFKAEPGRHKNGLALDGAEIRTEEV